ncbi:WASH complex subunit 4 isoform X2 [Condylostylus longicornis]|uniref:WASH complex subunit 4 isoform X2 n=1 Tax=Condylostylus longicornis TaxID=2530218 RepID=UPI00244E271B|nr:WASH complex subunit 4 isoform X2 [Condylostylus longicornis]
MEGKKFGLAKHQLQSFGKFFEDYSLELNSITSKFKSQSNERNELYFTQLTKSSKNPIVVNFQTGKVENINQFKLIDSDNKIFNKVVLTFHSLYNNLEEFNLKSEEFQADFLRLDIELESCQNSKIYEDIGLEQIVELEKNKLASNSEEVLIKISESMEFLCNMQFFINSGTQSAINLLQQLVNFHSFDKNYFGLGTQHNEILSVIELFMINLVKFDAILLKSNFHLYWAPYKKTIIQKFQQQNDSCSEREKVGLVRILNELELFLGGFVFQSFLENVYAIKDNKNISRLYSLTNNFNEYIKDALQQIKKYPAEICDESETIKLIGVNIFIVLQHRFFGQVEQKIFKQLLQINLKFIGVNLISKYIWYPEKFLQEHAETLLSGHPKYIQEQIRTRETYLQKKVEQLPKIVKKYCIETTMWIMKSKTSISSGYNLKIGQFKQLCILFLQGAQYAGQMNHICKLVLNLHEQLAIPMSKQTVTLSCKLLTLIKLIQIQLSADVEHISKIIKSVIDCLQYKCLLIIISTKKKLSAKTLSDEIVDIFSALKIIEKSLNGPPTSQRLFVVNLLIQSTNLQSYISVEDFEKLQKSLRRLKFLGRFQSNLSKICDLSYTAWIKALFDKRVTEIIDDETMPHFINVVCNIPNACKKYEDVDNGNLIFEIMCKLCGQIETFLRIEAHSGLQLKRINPFHQDQGNDSLNEPIIEIGNCFEDNRSILKLNVLNLNNAFINYKYNVENYLSNMFYNITTINLNDWKAYEIMRNLAKYKLNLEPISDLLPNHSLEQGKDALEIMRNIHIFVTKYNYNMNNQYFVENSSKNKYLNTICIKHVANSLQTHGSGFINTAVNFSYQFLRSKFYTISQFLYDEQIHSRLLKEHRYVVESKLENSNEGIPLPRNYKGFTSTSINDSNFIYKYERAEDLNKEIRALGMTPDGFYYMDVFRQLITEVGNTMGYIRLIRGGNIHAKYIESIYLPTTKETAFESLCNECETSEFLKKTGEVLDENLRNYAEKDEMDFFKLLSNAFKPFFRSSSNQHLKKFFLIVPALLINYVDHILNAREKISKRDNDGAITLFNDGFAMGLVCILKLLNQFNQFESLYWFKSVENKFKDEHQIKINEMQTEMRKNQKDNSLLQTLALVEKRMNAKFREFSLLRDSIYSAKIFYQ